MQYAGDSGLILGSGRSPGRGNGNPLQCSCMENPRDGGAWWAAVYGVAQSWTPLKWLSSSCLSISAGFQGGTSGEESACQCRWHKRCRFDPQLRKIPWRKAWQHTPVILPGESHGQRNLVGYSSWGCRESDTTEAT